MQSSTTENAENEKKERGQKLTIACAEYTSEKEKVEYKTHVTEPERSSRYNEGNMIYAAIRQRRVSRHEETKNGRKPFLS